MGWGFNNDEALHEYLRKVEEAHPNAFDLPGTDEDKNLIKHIKCINIG